MYHDVDPVADGSIADDPEQHHGDLRKGAFLKRRAAYQLQAATPSSAQAGGDALVRANRPQAGEPVKD